ncbi:hypothetical protein Naga_100001g83 [Nannochloropsis gaditana]|uniref:Uncharacterized protein n=1 Tax=Nannochloropsis gaditana TaxID=72520 RepID=W7U1U0_9STRA|nr:hypothetical protein Naga_100001g83 [Nannochloropsis gaditana]
MQVAPIQRAGRPGGRWLWRHEWRDRADGARRLETWGKGAQHRQGVGSRPHHRNREPTTRGRTARARTRSPSYILLQLSRRSSKMRKNFYDAAPALISMIVTMTWTCTSRMEEAGEVLGTSGSRTGLPPGR